MNSFDEFILQFLNRLSHKSIYFDALMNFLLYNYFFKGGMVMAVCWFLWFDHNSDLDKRRKGILATIISAFVAIAVGRCLALTLPFRLRPVYDPAVVFVRPYKYTKYFFDNWSSFPSDHAVLFFALATGVFLVSKKAGVLTSLYVLCFVLFPRIYFRLHYPTDILAGATVGIIITYIVSRAKVLLPLLKKMLQFSLKQPGYFYSIFFLVSLEICTAFGEIEYIVNHLLRLFRGSS